LFLRGTQREIGTGPDEVHYGFGLGQVHLAVEEGAFGKLARPRGARACSQARFENLRGDEDPPVTGDFDDVFTGVTGRRAVHRNDGLIDYPLMIDDFTEMLNTGSEGRWFVAPTEDLVRYGNGLQT